MNRLTSWRRTDRATTSINIKDHRIWDHWCTHGISQESNSWLKDINKMINNDACSYLLKMHSTSSDKHEREDHRKWDHDILQESNSPCNNIDKKTNNDECTYMLKTHSTSDNKQKHQRASKMKSWVDAWHITTKSKLNDINKMIDSDECTYILKIHSTSDDKQKDRRLSNTRS